MSTTVLAFDFGVKNIGVAIGQSEIHSAKPLKGLKAREGQPNWGEIEALLNEWKPDTVVVGLPLNMDGSEGEITRRARKFAQRIQGRFNQSIAFMDERLSSFEAKQEAKAEGHSGHYGRNPIDAIAARLILESWWRHPNKEAKQEQEQKPNE
ncbi:MAG: putative Holliday junction resolvase [Flavobacteriales bacterium]|jgi:putative Holliday junction resolvase